MPHTTRHRKEVGHIRSFYSGVATITGLPDVFLNEVLVDGQDTPVALVVGFDENHVEALIFPETISSDASIYRSERSIAVPISDAYIGRVVDGFGRPIDGLAPITGEQKSIFSEALPIRDREPVVMPVTTGIKIIDTTLPIGRGQRELVIGDRKLGKSTLALDMVLHQRWADPAVFCIYTLIGAPLRKLEEAITLFEKFGAFRYSCIVAATSADSYAAQYVAPFVAATIAEHVRDQGRDALVIYDDLTRHANCYRDTALLLGRAPGREAYPGDVFSIHAQLLERAGKRAQSKGGGSVTAIPIIETQEGDITSFIATNIISITDGQIYLERGLFQKGYIPAVNVALSVSRVGSQAQHKALKEVTSGLRLALAQQKELQKLTQLETVVSQQSKEKIYRGELILELLKQDKEDTIPWAEQVVLFYLVEHGFFDDLERDEWRVFERHARELIHSRYKEVLHEIHDKDFDQALKAKIESIATDIKQEFVSAKK